VADGDGLTFDASDLEVFAAELGEATRRIGVERRRSHQVVAQFVERAARAEARGGPRQVAHFAEAIRARATQRSARIAVAATSKRNAGALAAIWGMKRTHTGWMAGWWKGEIQPNRAKGYAGSPRNTLPWVGANWTIGVRGQGPRAINDAIAANQERIDDLYLSGYEAALAAAFPGGFER